MATIEECRSALDTLSANLAKADGAVRDATALDRSLSCRITDLDITFVGRLAGGSIQDVVTVPGTPEQKAQIRLAMTGDVLVQLVGGELHFAKAWGAGRVRVQAGLRDLLKLRSLL
ncbi:sterol-binding protein [Actinacidiphila reveromycinica]|uniref:sterol-binding protein n=1 Tax=Actinacidiphila reveromycinica TaxID=659352 RepID=UPI0019207D7B|nr:sterol-binding protein [Streptomyces sp. SN-593]